MNVWWCNQRESWSDERGESVICGSENTDDPSLRKTVEGIRPGDITLHYISKGQNIVAVSLAKSKGRYYARLPMVGVKDYGSGWRADVEYFVFHPVIPKSKFMDGLLEILKGDAPKNFPVNRNGDVMMGYLFPFTQEGLQVVRSSFKTVWPAWAPGFGPDEPSNVIRLSSEATPEPRQKGQESD